jgi:hypothetical protein
MVVGLVLTVLNSLSGAQPAKSMPEQRAASQLDKRVNPVIPPSRDSAAHAQGVW